MAVGVGTGFDISGLLDSITKADKALSNLMNKSNQTSRSIVTAFQQMSSQGVMPYVQSLEKNLAVYNAIRDSITDTAGRAKKGFGDMKADIDKVIVSTETLMTSLSRSPEFKFESQKKAAQDHRDFMVRMYTEMFDTIERREQQNKSAKQNSQSYAQNYQQQLSAYERLFDEAIAREDKKKKEQADRDAKREAEEHKRKIDNINKRFDLIERRNKRDAQRQTEYLNSPKGALEYARGLESGTKSINTMNQALQQLRNAQANVNINTEAGRKKHAELGNAIARVEKELKKYTNSANDVNDKHKSLINTGDQLKRALAGIFSVSAIKGYVNKLVEVRGEFELQHRSLQAIIQDIDKANVLWEKTVQLAVKSPFRVKELVTYTKQLAAYRIETDKLYDTTKMLADVSAGLGVDMNRLILAYGQVKSANFLRGTELRQFTEAGIPMLDELAKYFSEIEGRLVSASDVFERISKRGVLFEDVHAVLKRITSEGGVFYNMQEKQADTLKGMISNLRDSIDLMLNDIGMSQDGSLKGVISATKTIVENWRAVSVIIQQIGFGALINVLYKVAVGWKSVSLATFRGVDAMKGATKAGAALRLGLQKLFATIKAPPIGLLLAALGSAIHILYSYNKTIKETNQRYDELSKSESKKIAELKDLKDNIEENNKAINDNTDKEKDNTEAINKNKSALEKLKNEHPDVYRNIVANTDGTINLTNAIEEQNKKLRANIALHHQAKGGAGYQDLQTNYKQAMDAKAALQSSVLYVQDEANNVLQKLENTLQQQPNYISKEAYEGIVRYVNGILNAETAEDIFALERTLYKGGTSPEKNFNIGIPYLEDQLYRLENDYDRFEKRLGDFKENIERQMPTYSNIMPTFGDETERGKWLKEQLEILGVFDEEIQNITKDYIVGKTGFKIEFPKPDDVHLQLKAWQETYNKKFGDNTETKDIVDPFAGFVRIQNKNTKAKEVYERLQDEYKEVKTLIENITRAGGVKATAEGGAYEGVDLEKEKQNLKQIMLQLDFFGVPYEKAAKNGNEALERLKEQIRLIREAARAYDDMRKLHDEAYADKQIVEEYGPAFKEAKLGDISGYAFGTRQDEQNNLEKLRASAEKTTGGVLELNKAIAQVGVNIADADQEILDKDLFDSISDIFSNYEISLEMDKLNIPKDLASKLFGFDAIDLDDIRGQVLGKFGMGGMEGQSNEQIYSSDAFKNLSKERQEELRKSLEKEQQLQNKYLEENFKKYIEYSIKTLGERAKIKVDEINQLNEIGKTFKPVSTEGITDTKKLEEIKERNRLLKEQGEIAKKAVQEKSFQQMKQIEWDEFRSSDVLNNMFNDLDKASEMSINAAIKRIQDFKKEWKDMPVAAAKEMLKKLNELQLALYDSSNVRKDKKKIEDELNDEIERRGLRGKADTTKGQKNLSEAVQGENQAYTEIIEKSNKRIELLQLINSLEGTNKQEQLNKLGYTIEYLDALGITTEMVENTTKANDDLITKEQGIVDKKNEQIATNQKILNLITKQKSKAAELGEKWSKMLGMAKDLHTSFQDLSEAANWEFSDEMAIFGEMGVSMADAVINAIALSSQLAAVETGALAAGTALNTALGIVGLIVMAVQLLVAGIKALSDIGQNKRAKEIEKELKTVEGLSKKYEKLERSIENAASAAKLLQDSADMQENIAAQIEATEKAIDVYEEANYKKLSDEEKEDWDAKKEDLEKLKEKAKELKETVSSKASGGILDDVLSAADGFSDAWLSAFSETEDGMSGLESSFDDMIKSLIKRQMSLQFISPVIDKWKESLKKYVNEDDTVLSEEDAGKWASEVKNSFSSVNANLQAYAKALEEEGINLHADVENSQSGLSGAISGMSEEQADILAAYWNAVRLSTDSINNKIETIISKLNFGEDEASVIDNIRLIQINSKNIYELLQNVSTSGGSHAINVRMI